MASTNKTTNYELSQYIGTDKPTYLGDYNSDMSKIDTAIKGVSNVANSGKDKADSNESHIGELSSLETTARNNIVSAINEVKGNGDSNTNKIGNINDLLTFNKTDVVNAINEIINKFTLNRITKYTNPSQVTISGGTIESIDVTVATNSDGSIAKIYGYVTSYASGINNPRITIGTSLRPSTNISINAGVQFYSADSGKNGISSLEIKTNGEVIIQIWNSYYESGGKFIANLSPCLYFISDFGDTPITQSNI